MRIFGIFDRRGEVLPAILIAGLVMGVAGCGSGPEESKMTSYSSGETKGDTAELFTVPQDQMAHVQIAPVAKITLAASVAPYRDGGVQRIQNHSSVQCRRRTSSGTAC